MNICKVNCGYSFVNFLFLSSFFENRELFSFDLVKLYFKYFKSSIFSK
jgi:hypothetical protein